jgi:hypothetical protein
MLFFFSAGEKKMSDTYANVLFGSPSGTRQNNCYAWAIDEYREHGDRKLQPGELSGRRGGVDLRGCTDLVDRAVADAVHVGNSMKRLRDPGASCPAGSYKVMAFIDPGNDYHWYRQHRDVVYRVKTPRTTAQLAREFGVPRSSVHAPRGDDLEAGDLVLVRGANVWSHKQGHSDAGPVLKDACGKIIKDPRSACRDYGSLNYRVPCGALCFRKKPRSLR